MPVEDVTFRMELDVNVRTNLEDALQKFASALAQTTVPLQETGKVVQAVAEASKQATESAKKSVEYLEDILNKRARELPTIDSITKTLEATAGNFVEQFLVSVGGARARWGYWRIFLEVARGLMNLAVMVDKYAKSFEKQIEKLKEKGEYEKQSPLAKIMSQIHLRVAKGLPGILLSLARISLMTVGIMTLIKHLVFDTAKLSGYMSAVAGLIKTMYVLIFMPIANILGAVLLPVMLTLLPVVIKINEFLNKLLGVLEEKPEAKQYLGSTIMGIPILARVLSKYGWRMAFGSFLTGSIGYFIGSEFFGQGGGLIGGLIGSILFPVIAKRLFGRFSLGSIFGRILGGAGEGIAGGVGLSALRNVTLRLVGVLRSLTAPLSMFGRLLAGAGVGLTALMGVLAGLTTALAGLKMLEHLAGGREALAKKMKETAETYFAGHETLQNLIKSSASALEQGGVKGTLYGAMGVVTMGFAGLGKMIADELNTNLIRGMEISVDVVMDGDKVAEKIATRIGGRW